MTLLDLPRQAPRLVCGIKRNAWGLHEPLACILDMNHQGRIHQDRMGRTWELLIEYTPRAHHVDIVSRLVALLQGSQQVLERLTLLDSHELYTMTEDIAGAERKRITDTLVALGLVDVEPAEFPPNGGHADMCAYVAGISSRCTCRTGDAA